MNKNMRIHEDHEAVWAYGEKNLFCSGFGLTKQIFTRAFGRFCLMLPHNPHTLRIVTLGRSENMRIMRIYEDRLFKEFYLPCIKMGGWARPKHEAGMRIHEAHPHVLASNQANPYLISFYFLLLPTFARFGG